MGTEPRLETWRLQAFEGNWRAWTRLGEFSAQPRISQYSTGEVTRCGVLPQPYQGQFHAQQINKGMVFVREPGQRRVFPAIEPDHKPHNGFGQKWNFEESLAAPFDLSQDHGMTTGDQSSASAFDANPIVSNKPRE